LSPLVEKTLLTNAPGEPPVGIETWGGASRRRAAWLDHLRQSRHSSHVRTAAVTDLKNRLSHYLRLVARGEHVTILDRGRPVARLSRVDADDAELDALVGAGLARPPIRPLPRNFLTRELPRSTASVAEALIEDRADRF
jgi:prevent-host-death family protein